MTAAATVATGSGVVPCRFFRIRTRGSTLFHALVVATGHHGRHGVELGEILFAPPAYSLASPYVALHAACARANARPAQRPSGELRRPLHVQTEQDSVM